MPAAGEFLGFFEDLTGPYPGFWMGGARGELGGEAPRKILENRGALVHPRAIALFSTKIK